ncbi:hypothetical protein Kpol_1030p17 [Vanderwaltozyma polyspora DSM 70294]|uniref:Uncharacterized protein n=1 Tax=Vanderwaltozyma polyspora (strain ATCC 22028 / DSM 70294 / BCRC 21397 / CBS 2163 / NBRC 10782 / NRRL Y-8283 / UCD 57-17) TaxID=436907 RepID=A7TMT7_VANPO|nr:uncharacterized protein Kpol_1030p17 [Vanderwaltozyma polyspora DSM 70294]EDO16409.1 hypothetical protein Kpol_1030p17 [Vanderwaltozyma polyspora DSM 70294]
MNENTAVKIYNNITLRSLSAYQLLSYRENMCELFQLLDDSEKHGAIVNDKRQERTLQSMKEQIEALKKESD